ncbi:MAG: HAD-IA family hydrolase [Firmicutes bacterium]|nr:HAD-IA family hydrolase [Bacillota bacterium]
MRKINTILFDFDGTLMDTNEVIIQSWQYAFKKIKGVEGDREAIIRTFGEPLALTLKKFFGGTEEDITEFLRVYRDYQTNVFEDEIVLFPGVYDMLHKFKELGYRMAVVTSRLSQSTYEGLRKFGVLDLFDVVVTADDTKAHKPDPEPANIALAKLGTSAEEAVMVGDTRMDMGCAKNAGLISVLVGWSMAIIEDPADQPDYVVEKADDLIALLEKLNA